MGKTIVGLELTEESVRAAEITVARTPQLIACGEVPLPPDAAKDSEVLDAGTIAVALRQLWAGARFKSRDVVLGVASRRILVREYTTQAMRPDLLREALPYQVQDLLPVPVNDALLDFYPVSTEQTDQGPMVHGLLVAAIRDAVLGNVEAAEAAGLHVAEVDLIPFALTRLLLGGQSGMTALVDIGASTTYLDDTYAYGGNAAGWHCQMTKEAWCRCDAP